VLLYYNLQDRFANKKLKLSMRQKKKKTCKTTQVLHLLQVDYVARQAVLLLIHVTAG
jgi:hypothetical protein